MAAAIRNILTQINWLDITVVIILIRISYIGIKGGLVIEIFKVLSMVFAIYLSLHYFSVLSDFLSAHWPIPLDFSDFICFTFLISLCLIIWVPLRVGLLHLIKIETVDILSKFGGLILGLLRGFLFVSLIVLTLEFSTITYLGKIVKTSLTGLRLSEIAPKVYETIHEGIIIKFFPNDKLNEAVYEIMDEVEG